MGHIEYAVEVSDHTRPRLYRWNLFIASSAFGRDWSLTVSRASRGARDVQGQQLDSVPREGDAEVPDPARKSLLYHQGRGDRLRADTRKRSRSLRRESLYRRCHLPILRMINHLRSREPCTSTTTPSSTSRCSGSSSSRLFSRCSVADAWNCSDTAGDDHGTCAARAVPIDCG